MQENINIKDEENETVTEDAAEQTADEKLYTKAELDELLNAEREQLGRKLAEAEKLAGMSEAARSDYKRELLDKELSEREAAVARRELMADAVEKLEAAGLPKQLAACLNYSGRDECLLSIETIGRAFTGAVTAAVNERIRGKAPKLSADGSCDAFLNGLGMY